MKFNVSYPVTGLQKLIEIDDEKKVSIFYGKRMGNEVAGDELGEQFKGYIFKITGGNDKDGFPMKQGILVQGRVRLLMAAGHKTYRPRRKGERKRKSVRGCIVGADLAILSLAIVKEGDSPIAGLTDDRKPRRLGPKRANKIRKLFNLKKDDDVKKYVIRREVKKEGKKLRIKAPKIQRLITDVRLRRKKIAKLETENRRKRSIKQREEYHDLLHKIKAQKVQAATQAAQAQAQQTQPADKKATATKAKVPETKTQAKAPVQTTTKGGKPEATKVAPTQAKTTATTTKATTAPKTQKK